MNPKVAIVTLNWNGWKDTLECLESLYRITYPNYDVIVVDNGSEDESVQNIREYCEGEIEVGSKFFEYSSENKPIKIIEYTREEAEDGGGKEWEIEDLPSNRKLILVKNEKNYGFAGGNNIGIHYALKNLSPDYILLLNNDTIVNPNFLYELVKVAESNPKIGIIGPKIYYYDEPNRIWAIGDFRDKDKIDDGKFNDIREVEIVNGCAFFVRVELIREVGLLDSDFFVYCEEIDYCIRAKRRGYKLYSAPNSIIWHKVPPGRYYHKSSQVYYVWKNSIILRYKNYKGAKFFSSLFNFFLIETFLMMLSFLKRGEYNLVISIIRGIKDGISWCITKRGNKNTS